MLFTTNFHLHSNLSKAFVLLTLVHQSCASGIVTPKNVMTGNLNVSLPNHVQISDSFILPFLVTLQRWNPFTFANHEGYRYGKETVSQSPNNHFMLMLYWHCAGNTSNVEFELKCGQGVISSSSETGDDTAESFG